MQSKRLDKQIALYEWVLSFPPDSLQRLTAINNAASSAKHVLLALTYAFRDGNIRRLNKLIIQLLLTRMRAERSGDQITLEIVQNKLTDVHVAIDWATGVLPPFSERTEGHASCNRFVRTEAA